MEIRKELLREHSKAQTLKIVKFIGNDAKKFKQLIALFLSNEYRISQRAAWVVNYCAMAHPELIKPHLEQLVNNLGQPKLHEAVKRNTVRILQFIPVPEQLQGTLAEHCFRLLSSPDEPIAIRVFSMGVLANLCKEHPELSNELICIIEEQLPYGSKGYISRARKVLKQLRRS